MNKCIIYIGEFDLRNENVQAHLVKNNSKIFNNIGYSVAFIGMNRFVTAFDEIAELPSLNLNENLYFELPNTLSIKGLFNYFATRSRIVSYLKQICSKFEVEYIISYQSPTYAFIIKDIANFCASKKIAYIVNSADIPIFDSQPLVRRLVMRYNWDLLHKYNYRYADGIISVSSYIDNFYKKTDRPSVIIPPLFDEEIDDNFEINELTTFVYAGTPFISSKSEVKVSGMKDRLDKIIDLCISLLEDNIKYKLIVIGIDKETYCLNVPRHKSKLRENKQIFFLGRKSHSDTLRIVRSSDYMIIIEIKTR